jgi:predicted permease
LVRTFVQLQRVDLGFRGDGLLSFRLALPGSRYASADAVNAFGRQLQSELLRIPGAQAAGAISHLPYDDLPNWGGPYTATRGADPSIAAQADYRAVAPGTLAALGARLLDGRFFTESDDPRSTPVVIVDDQLAQKAWPGQRAVGRALGLDPGSSGRPTTWVTVVGVVRHLRLRSLVAPLGEQVYFPERQVLRNPMAYVVRVSGDPSTVTGQVRETVSRLDPALPIYDVQPVRAYVSAARATQRFTMVLAGTFAAVAGVLACVGIYGVVAYAVVRRRREFGVRLALGARPGQLVRSVMREGAVVALGGLALGGLAAASATRLIRAQLFGVTPDDLVTYTTVISVLSAAAMLASWIPARRAARHSPVEALRME